MGMLIRFLAGRTCNLVENAVESMLQNTMSDGRQNGGPVVYMDGGEGRRVFFLNKTNVWLHFTRNILYMCHFFRNTKDMFLGCSIPKEAE